MSIRELEITKTKQRGYLHLGTLGHLGIFLWCLGFVLLVPQEKIHWAAMMCLGVVSIIYPQVLRRVIRLRYMVFLLLLALPPIFFLGEIDRSYAGVGLSSTGMAASLQIALRFIVILVAVDGFTNAVDIAAVAGLLERLGLRGLGFSMGVALNLFPCLLQSCVQTWQSLHMRGGLRRRWWRGLRLLGMTVVTNTLRRAEEIAMVAEARNFSPECCRPMPLERSSWDWITIPILLVSILVILQLP
jgi:energy-coupling factor transporter transmembrane protein EcfT